MSDELTEERKADLRKVYGNIPPLGMITATAAEVEFLNKLGDEYRNTPPSPWPPPIPVTERLPEDDERVLAYFPNTGHGKYCDGWRSAEFKKGKVATGKIGEGIYFADQWGNNKVPYRWQGQGPMTWFGQQASHWLPLPQPPE